METTNRELKSSCHARHRKVVKPNRVTAEVRTNSRRDAILGGHGAEAAAWAAP